LILVLYMHQAIIAPGHNYDSDSRDADADTELRVWINDSAIDPALPGIMSNMEPTVAPDFALVPGAWSPSADSMGIDIMADQI